MASHATHKFWMKISAITIGSFGPVFALATMPAFSEPARWTLDFLSGPLDGFPSYEAPEMWFLSALAGGFLVGWGVLVWCLSVWVYDHAPEACRKALLFSALSWYTVDSLGSIAAGVWQNAIWNIVVLLLVVGPMWRPADAAVAD